MSGFLDYAEDMNATNMLTGFLLIIISLGAVSLTLSSRFTSGVNNLQASLLFLHGLLLLVGGFLQGEALYLRYFIDFSSIVGLSLLATAVFPELITTGLWMKLAVVSTVFIALPSTALAYLNRESRYERQREDDRDYLQRD